MPEIMIPLVGTADEMSLERERLEEVVKRGVRRRGRGRRRTRSAR